jgi:hypothetical protein
MHMAASCCYCLWPPESPFPLSVMTTPLCLVTGGSGFLGINLIRCLLAHGYVVRSLDLEPFEFPERVLIDARLGDIRLGK